MDTRKNIALIWARGNGSSLHRKSVYPILGRPLIDYILDAARKSGVIDRLYVFTEDEEVAAVTRGAGWQVIPRFEHMVEYSHPNFNSDEISRHQNQCILRDLGAPEAAVEEAKITPWVKGLFHLNCNYVLIRPSSIQRMVRQLVNDESMSRICLGVRVEPHLFIINPETGVPFPIWHQQGMDRREYPPLYRALPDVSFTLIDRLKKGTALRFTICEIDRRESLDIHTEEDVRLAEFYLASANGQDRPQRFEGNANETGHSDSLLQ